MLQNQSDEVSGFGKEVDNKKIILPEKQIQDTKGNGVLNGTGNGFNGNGISAQVMGILLATPLKLPEREYVFVKNVISFTVFVLSDILALFSAYALMKFVFGVSFDFLMSAVIFSFFAFVGHLYQKRFPFWDEIAKILKVSVVAGISYYFVSSYSIGKTSILWTSIFWALSAFFVIVFRNITKELSWILGLRKKAVIIGAGLGGLKILRTLDMERGLGYDIIGFLDDDKTKQFKPVGKFRGKDVLVIGKTCEIWNIIEETKIDEVILAIPSLGDKALTALASHLQKFVPSVAIVPDMFGLPVNIDLNHSFGEQTIFLSVKNNLANPFNRLLKELFDKILSIIILFLILPVIVIIAVLIKIDSPGPIIFSHERVGKGGRRFKCYKFRTMYVNNEEILKEYLAKHPEYLEVYLNTGKIPGGDPRVTRVGRILRKFSLDELPQIFNVIKGDMSLVGPRALIPQEVQTCAEYYLEWSKYIKPGITGLAQVMGRANISHIDKNIISLWYMKNWSIWLDIVIILKTIKVVLKAEGAY
jgi:undecaprenyl-phosphate galactose phosphotransferase